MEIRGIEDRDQLLEFFLGDPVACAYQIGDLDDAYFPWCRWWGAFDDDDDQLKLALLLYSGLSVPVALTYGQADLLEPLLEEIYADLPDRFYCQAFEDHYTALSAQYDASDMQPKLRMALRRDDYEPVPADPDVIRLGHRDTARIVKLYDHYPDNFFEPYQLETGLYFGITEGSGGELVSIAGIHVLSQANDVAAIGNLVTHPDHRGKQLARRVTGRLLNEVFERVGLVALNVSEENVPAVRTYSHFKFEPHSRFYEGLVKRSLLPRG